MLDVLLFMETVNIQGEGLGWGKAVKSYIFLPRYLPLRAAGWQAGKSQQGLVEHFAYYAAFAQEFF